MFLIKLFQLTKNKVKTLLGRRSPFFEYNHTYGNVANYRKCEWDINFIKTSASINLQESYTKLITLLDDNSIEIVSKCIGRVFLLNDTLLRNINIFTSNEIANIIDANVQLQTGIIKLNDNCYAYKNYFLPINDFEVSTFIYKYGLHLVNKAYLNEKSVIDAGAYIGDSCILFEKELTNISKIYGFEPSRTNFELLKKTIALNKSSKIIPVNVALGDRVSNMCLAGKGMGKSLTANDDMVDKNAEIVSLTTLDKYIEENNIKVGLIKTDLEGYEQIFLKGAINTIKKHRPVLVISIYHSAQDYFQIINLINGLDLGYKFCLYKADDGYIIAGTLLICQIPFNDFDCNE